MTGHVLRAEGSISIGEHVTGSVFGVTLNLDTIWSTVVAGAIVIGLGLWMRVKWTNETPSKIQLLWEGLVGQVNHEVESNLGRLHPFVVPLAVALFFFILIANWLEIIPAMDKLPAPTSDVNLVYAMALLVIVGVHIHGVKEQGFKGYFKHYAQPSPFLLPLNILEEIVKPVTLSLRLFGNMLAGGLMISLIAFLLPLYTIWGANAIWKLFDMFIGAIQAFIFALLTVIYFGMMSAHQADHTEHGDEAGSEGDGGDAPPAGEATAADDRAEPARAG
ncbi:MAG TPA: F0F1 ATP synthase subunit A [Nocardioidaceae bacterium]|nr:F0F1 ATP synthase subunit A [Nocardioidaceae bacterium]